MLGVHFADYGFLFGFPSGPVVSMALTLVVSRDPVLRFQPCLAFTSPQSEP
jgi:hypothetical protein